ncbi:helix-turn-helix domain-containing protein [Streptomyces physcomitrii]
MNVPASSRRCGFCGRPVRRRKKTGRPPEYCNKTCRRQAQGRRDREHRALKSARALRRALSCDLVDRVHRIHAAGQARAPLAEVVRLTDCLQQDSIALVAAVVDEKRAQGQTWVEIAGQAGRTSTSARARWGGGRVREMLSARAMSEAEPGSRARLGRALRLLRRRSGISLAHLARVTGLPGAVIASLLRGDAVASWPETYMLTHALGGEPKDIRSLWELAREVGADSGVGSEGGRER